MSTRTLYECGCVGEEVGQQFDRTRGIMVCPVHGLGFAPHEHEQTFRGRLTVTLELDTETREQAERWLDNLCDSLQRDDAVRAITSSLEQRGVI